MSVWPDRPRALISYAYLQGHPSLDRYRSFDLVLDSGAFTAWSLGISIDMRRYADFIKREAENITHAVALDVIGDWKASARNYDRLRDLLDGAVEMLPIWHLGSPLSEMTRLCREYEYVAIGGAVPHAKTPKRLMQHLLPAHKIARDAGVRLHGLGITGRTAMHRLPWTSVDSSSWVSAHRFGALKLRDETGELIDLPFGKPLSLHQRRVVRAYGGDAARIQSDDFCLIGKAGKEVGGKDRAWAGKAAAKSVMLDERAHRLKHAGEFKVHLVTNDNVYSDWIEEAWREGSPW